MKARYCTPILKAHGTWPTNVFFSYADLVKTLSLLFWALHIGIIDFTRCNKTHGTSPNDLSLAYRTITEIHIYFGLHDSVIQVYVTMHI